MLQHQKCVKKGLQILEVCLMVLVRGARECFFEWLWGVLPGVAELFLLQVCQQFVRWGASYKAKPFPKKFEIWPGPKF